MSGDFTVAGTPDPFVSMSAGGAGAVGTGDYTMVALYKPSGNSGIMSGFASGTEVRAFLNDTGQLFGTNDFSGSTNTVTSGNWYVVAESKAAGTNVYRWHIWLYAADGSGTMSHADGTGTHGDGSALTELRIGTIGNRGNSLTAVVGYWTRVLSDAELDSIKSPNLSTWTAVSGGAPAALISFQNWNGTNGATDVVGTSTFSSLTGNVGVGADPPSFNYALSTPPSPPRFPPLPILRQHVAATEAIRRQQVGISTLDATVTPSTVTAVAAVPAPAVQISSMIAATTVAAVAAVPAPTVKNDTRAAASTVAAVAAVPAPTVKNDTLAAAATVAAVAAVGTPAVSIASTITASTVAAVAAVGTPAVQIASTITASTVAAVAAVGAPTVKNNTTAVASTVAAVAAVGSPSVSAGGSATINATTVAAVASVGNVTVQIAVTVTAGTVQAVAAVGAATVTAGNSATILAATVHAVAAVGAAIVAAGGTVAHVDGTFVTAGPSVHVVEPPPTHVVGLPFVHVS